MIRIEDLVVYGADTDEGIARCMGMEGFYLQLVETQLEDSNFDKLASAIEAGDTKAAFDAAHALKGAVGNLALTPMYEPVSEMTERLRGASGPVDVSDLMNEFRDAYERLKALVQ